MELELKRIEMDGFELAADTTFFAEETLESIVPDACPDILRILSTRGNVCIRSREIRDGRAELRGTVCAQVLYIPDGEETVRHVDVTIPFACGVDHSAVRPGCVIHVFPGVVDADTRMLNPRKVYVRTQLAFHIICYSPCQKQLVCGSNGETALGLQEKLEEQSLCIIRDVQSRSFSFSDEFYLPSGRPDLREILAYRTDIICSESRIIGSRLIFKGQTTVTMLYRDVDGIPATASFEVPFSQIMEVSDAQEGTDHTLDVSLSEVSCTADGEDPRMVSISMNYMAQVVLRETVHAQLLTDLYSTNCEMMVETKEEELCRCCTEEVVRQELREVLETPVALKEVVDLFFCVGAVEQKWEGNVLRPVAEVRARLLYQGEDGGYYELSRALSASTKIDADPDHRYTVWCGRGREGHVSPTPGGAEVRTQVDFYYRTEEKQTIKKVVQVTPEEDAAHQDTDRPSIVLRRAGQTESLWQIAKMYRTTRQDIMEANGISEQEGLEGRMLLIPKRK